MTLGNGNREDWDLALPYAMMAYRATPHTTTGYTPNMLVYGREATMPSDILYGQTGVVNRKVHGCYCAYVDWLRNTMINAYVVARQRMGIAAQSQKVRHDEDSAPRVFKAGDWVWYYHKPTSNMTLSTGWTGPFVVVEQTSQVDYKIQRNPVSPEKTVHCDYLQPDLTSGGSNWILDEIARREAQKPIKSTRGCQTSVEIPATVDIADNLPDDELNLPLDEVHNGAGSKAIPVVKTQTADIVIKPVRRRRGSSRPTRRSARLAAKTQQFAMSISVPTKVLMG